MNRPTMMVGNRKVGEDQAPLVVAEIGINHEGSLATAKQMVDAAIEAGAEVIKHQTHVIADEMSDHAKDQIPGNAEESIYEIMERCALSESDERELMSHVEANGAIFISTPFSRAAVDRLEGFGVRAYKIGSGECNNYPLVEYVASKGKPVILSTGMNDIKSIAKSVEIFRKHEVSYALLHCTNIYPTPDEHVRLGCLAELREAFPDAQIGLSDHSLGNVACLGAVALGATILERHFTDTKSRPGPDIACSMDIQECRELIEQSSRLHNMRHAGKGAVEEELVTMSFAFASVVAIRDITKGETLGAGNIWVRRPGTGDFNAEDFESLLGRKTARAVASGSQLQREDLAS